ncbi:MAG: DUF2203 domain-containing protein [Planctomycetaceae bacterium]
MNTTADRKFFGVDDANRMLPLVSAIVADIVELYNDVHERRNRLARVRHNSSKSTRSEDNPYEEEVLQIEKELEADIDRLDGFVEELQKLGVELKDPVKGLVDFPTYHQGREAYLCWMLGEQEVAYWHDLDAGFGGRQPLQDTPISEI